MNFEEFLRKTWSNNKQILRRGRINIVTSEVNDFTDFTEAERRLADIWRYAFSLSPAQYAALNRNTSIYDFLVKSATFKGHVLKETINKVLGIPIYDFANDALQNYNTLSELAAFIDRTIEYKGVIQFVTHWLDQIFNFRTTEQEIAEKLDLLPVDCRVMLLDILKRREYSSIGGIHFRDIYPRKVLESQIQVMVKAENWFHTRGDLTVSEDLNLVFMLQMKGNQAFQILELVPLI